VAGVASPVGACSPRPSEATRVLLEYDIGILTELAATVHHGVRDMFEFRDPTVQE